MSRVFCYFQKHCRKGGTRQPWADLNTPTKAHKYAQGVQASFGYSLPALGGLYLPLADLLAGCVAIVDSDSKAGALDLRRTIFSEYFFEQRDKWRQILFAGLPYCTDFYAPIFVDCKVAHITHQPPWNGRILFDDFNRHISCSFTDDNEITNNSVESFGILLKSSKVHSFKKGVKSALDSFQFLT